MVRYITKKYLCGGCDPAFGRRKAGLLLSIAGICLNLLLFGVKCVAGSLSGSIAITADGFNNLADTGACGMVILGLTLGDRKPCRSYPFGYGRFEYLSGMLIGGVVLFLGGRLMAESVAKIIHPAPIDGKPVVLLMLVFSILVKGYMYLFNKRIGVRIRSAGMQAASMDALADCVATLAIIVAIFVENLTGLHIDGYTGALVALCILWAGVKAVKDSLEPLLGRGIDENLRRRIEYIVRRHREICSVSGLALHDYGPQKKLLTLTVTLRSPAPDTIRLLKQELQNELQLDAVVAADSLEISADGIKTDKTVKNNSREQPSTGA